MVFAGGYFGSKTQAVALGAYTTAVCVGLVAVFHELFVGLIDTDPFWLETRPDVVMRINVWYTTSFIKDDPNGVTSIWDQFAYLFVLTLLSSLCEYHHDKRPQSWAEWKKTAASVSWPTLGRYIAMEVNDWGMWTLMTLGNLFGVFLTWWWAWEMFKEPQLIGNFFSEFRINREVPVRGNDTFELHKAASRANLMGPCYGWDFMGILMAAGTYLVLDEGWKEPWSVLLGPTYMLSRALGNMKDNKVKFRAGVMYTVSALLSWYLWVDGFANWMDHGLVRRNRSEQHWDKPTLMLGHFHTFASFLCLGPGLVMYIQERCKVRTYWQKVMWGFLYFYTLRLHVALAVGFSFGIFRGLPNEALGCDPEIAEAGTEVEQEEEESLSRGSPRPTRRYMQPNRTPERLYKRQAAEADFHARRAIQADL